MAKVPGFFARTFTEKGRTRAARQSIVANRKAQEQSLFGFDRKTTDLWNQKRRNMSQDEAISSFEYLNQQGKQVGSRIAELKAMQGRGGLSRADSARINSELNSLQKSGKSIGETRREVRDVMDGKSSYQIALSQKEQLMNKGKAAAHYMWGGDMRQIAARNGAVVGGIVGVNVAADAIGNIGNSSGPY